MLVEINLLPQSEKRNRQWLFAVIGIAAVGLIALILLFILSSNEGKKVDALSSELQGYKQLRAEKEQSISNFESSDAWVQLESAVGWAESYPIETVPVLDGLVELLPERGFMKEFTYGENGRVGVTVQFDTSREAAYYLTHLKESEYILDANLLAVETEEISGSEIQNVINTEVILPRYTAQYELTLNREAIKSKENETEEQGGDSE
ncbi:hypothetical protein [Bacillus sp. KH172YL63]|uniref:hypothetical protein n=1 Tax=Bacillus sp. KH172YL63 TaxID=2709784 RepID=UPI0013E4E19C|nr:hypothetical protein [Bacillus sp. KH172YL63]BCB05000.1 hypothetical protein KH172YL63_31330 [Bacillus sp. KH172YL63]